MSALPDTSGMDAFNVEGLLAAACAETRLTEYGEPPLRPALDHLVASILSEADLTPAGMDMRRRHILRLLSNRLRLAAFLKGRDPVAVGKKIFIVGMPRSGTTKLHRLLARDERLNTIPTWQLLYPVPLSDDASDRPIRRQLGRMYADGFRKRSSDCYVAHPIDAEEPEEETWLMQHSFLTDSIEADLKVPTYLSWLRGQDVAPMYGQLSRWFEAIAAQTEHPTHPWLLKGTFHGAHLDALAAAFPDAAVLYCHRDPLDSLPSYCSLTERLRGIQGSAVDRIQLGRQLLQSSSDRAARMRDARRVFPRDRIIDLSYRSICHHPDAVLEEIYRFLGIDLPVDIRSALLTWEAQSQAGVGRHQYAADHYGLSEHDILEAFSDYRHQFAQFIE